MPQPGGIIGFIGLFMFIPHGDHMLAALLEAPSAACAEASLDDSVLVPAVTVQVVGFIPEGLGLNSNCFRAALVRFPEGETFASGISLPASAFAIL